MDLLDWILKYWQILAVLVTAIASWVKYNADLVNIKIDMKSQKEEHDKQITDMKFEIKSNEVKVDALKDKLTESINDIQKNIVEIMTILKTSGQK